MYSNQHTISAGVTEKKSTSTRGLYKCDKHAAMAKIPIRDVFACGKSEKDV